MTDTLPMISQIKSIMQLLFGQTSKALETQVNFIEATPLLSQLKSLYEIFVKKNLIQAIETQHKFLIITNATIDGIPLIGHIKGLGHYIIGDFKNGHNAMKRSSRTTVVILSAYFAATIYIPTTATMEATITASSIASIIGGISMDTLITLIENIINKDGSLNGIYYTLTQIFKNPFDIGNIFDFIMGPILDGLIGAFIGFKIYQFRNPPIPPPPPPHPHPHIHRAVVTKTINTLPPPPHIPPTVPLHPIHPVPLPPIPLPIPFNPWDPKSIPLPIIKQGLRYGTAAAVLQRHAKHN